MKNATYSFSTSTGTVRTILIDMAALAFIYFVPSLVHFFNFPVYMIEPMRVMLILSLAHSNRLNSYILALTLPAFSFVVSGHPEFFKMLIITVELVVNVFLFYYLLGRMKNTFLAMLSAILLAKIACYLMYLVFFSVAFVRAEADPLFLGVQLATTLLFSSYIFLFFRDRLKNHS